MAICLDRFAQGLADVQGVEAINECDECGLYIYKGETYYRDGDGRALCKECAQEYCRKHKMPLGELISEVAGEEVPPWAD